MVIELYNLHYDISQPVDSIFKVIEDIAELAEHANSPITDHHMIDLANVIFANMCNRQPAIDRTWSNMLIHFREAHAELFALPTAGGAYHREPTHLVYSVDSMVDLVAQRLLVALQPLEEPSDLPTSLENSLQRRETDL